jgi:hypothetical protein
MPAASRLTTSTSAAASTIRASNFPSAHCARVSGSTSSVLAVPRENSREKAIAPKISTTKLARRRPSPAPSAQSCGPVSTSSELSGARRALVSVWAASSTSTRATTNHGKRWVNSFTPSCRINSPIMRSPAGR